MGVNGKQTNRLTVKDGFFTNLVKLHIKEGIGNAKTMMARMDIVINPL